tara:strand:- start:2157 stop:2927 length:771 start_codon:yes stop_codon:yes gene_type:complete
MGKALKKSEAGGLPAELANEMANDAGDGAEGITAADLAIPFLRILQQMSPQLAKRNGAFIDGAGEGDIFNTVTGQIWDPEEGVLVIPCSYNFKIIEWIPRDSGGGIANQYTRNDTLPPSEKDERGKDITGTGNQLTDTAEHYVLIVNSDGTYEQALITMSSTQLKHSRRWNSLTQQQTIMTDDGPKTAPLYSRMYRLKTTGESKDDNNWSGWNITLEGPVEDLDLYRSAKAFCASVKGGDVLVKHELADGAEASVM